jgi:hypothetical protein
MVEAKVIEKIRNVLKADSTIKGLVADRIYASHISSVERPTYPAISITLLPGQARTNIPEMVNMVLQIDLWFPADSFTSDQVCACYDRVRALLHRQALSDTTIGIKIEQFIESAVGPLLFDEASSCLHLPARFNAVAI